MSKRILLKISGESLMGSSTYGIDVSTINKISNEIKNVYKKKYQICLIIGGGNIFRGIKGASEGIDRSTSDYMGMLATVMNSLALQNALEQLKLETRVMSAFPIQSICETYIRRRAIRHMEKGRIVICAAGTGRSAGTCPRTSPGTTASGCTRPRRSAARSVAVPVAALAAGYPDPAVGMLHTP